MSNSIGNKITFWSLVKDRITIPTLQRDYIYGAGTEKTEEVLCNMLSTFKAAFEFGNEETVDFVYGSESKAKEFMPLDGQQRLTTLFLLHYYAALIARKTEEYPDVVTASEDDFKVLGRFSYATRNSTISFCNQLLIGKHQKLSEIVANAEKDNKTVISSYLKDLDDFRNSFYTDPSVMSMIVVLDRIHSEFYGMTTLWQHLISNDCKINFYQLDFGIFDLSDDLYNKMNSRGKPLTNFEIFKAKMHKQIKKQSEQKADKIAIKLDTDWMQFIWETLDHTLELKAVDPAYIWFIKNVFRTIDYISGYEKQRFAKLDDTCLKANMNSFWRIKAMENVFDIFAGRLDKIPLELQAEYKSFIVEAVKDNIKNNRLLCLYAIYLGLYLDLENKEFCFRFRHVRNMINNSSDQIREDNMSGLLCDITHVMEGKLLKVNPKILNRNSWTEEQNKEKYPDVWSTLFQYEDIPEINGTLQAFCSNINSDSSITLGDQEFVNALKLRLKKAAHFFTETGLEEFERRSALLSLGNYGMSSTGYPSYRYFGVIKGSWQNFTGYHRFDERNKVMEIIDKIDTTRPIKYYVKDTSTTDTEHWRFYAIKYAREITVAYRSNDYGYIFFKDIDSKHPYNEDSGYLDAIILQSSYYSSTNVAWKLIHRVLEQRCNGRYHFYLDNHGGSPFLLSKISNEVKLDIQKDGWHIIGLSPEVLSETGLVFNVICPIQKDSNITNLSQPSDCLYNHKIGTDFVKEGEHILEQLSKKYSAILKEQ